jgi:Glyoxalase-like domain
MRVNEDIDGWVVIGSQPGLRQLAFQRVTEWVPPRWPDLAYPQQLHLDIRVSDADRAEQELLALGATRVPGEGRRASVSSPTPPVTHSASFSATPAQTESSSAHSRTDVLHAAAGGRVDEPDIGFPVLALIAFVVNVDGRQAGWEDVVVGLGKPHPGP